MLNPQMPLPTPLLSRFQSLVWGAVIGGAWGWRYSPVGQIQRQGSRTTLFDVQDFWVQVSTDQAPEFLHLAQQTQLLILRCCAQAGKTIPTHLHPTLLSGANVDGIEGLEHWIAGLIATLLPAKSSQDPPPDATHEPDMSAIRLLWRHMLFSEPSLSAVLNTLMPQWLKGLAQNQIKTDLAQLLQMAEAAVVHHVPVGQFVARLSPLDVTSESVAIAIAWYCFRCTPHDLALNLTRAVQFSPQPYLSSLLTGTWSSLYNGKVIVAPQGGSHLSASFPPLADHTIVSNVLPDLLRSVTVLFATWAGVSSLNDVMLNPRTLLTITAPRQMLHV